MRRLAQKLSLDAAGGPSTIEQRFEFYDFGTKVDIRVPDPDEVTDVSDLAAARARRRCGSLTLSSPSPSPSRRVAVAVVAAPAWRPSSSWVRGPCRRGS